MSAGWIVPVVVISYYLLVFFYSGYMVKKLDTNYTAIILIGIFLPPIWLIMALVSLFYSATGKDIRRTAKIEIKNSPTKKKKSPTKKKKV